MKTTILGFATMVALAFTGWALTAEASASTPSNQPANCCCIVQSGDLICTITGEVLQKCCCK